MLRVVVFRKAAVAGAAGALAWEAAARTLAFAGLPMMDIVRSLGTLIVPHGSTVEWWLSGLAAHVLVGIVWAIFYAYFFWGRLSLRPTLQGLIFAIFPAFLAITIALPQLRLMHLAEPMARISLESLASALTLDVLAGVLAGHAIFGLCLGALYHHPVGYRAGEAFRPAIAAAPDIIPGRSERGRDDSGFIFATGMECSYPTIEQGQWRRDQLQSTGHYERWPRDFELARSIGVTHLRYGPPLHLTFVGPGSYDWSLVDAPLEELRDRGPTPIVDLCHFGLPSWLGNFQNRDIAAALAEYAGAFAERYPWVRFYTPVNEMFVCARNSTLGGIWNEQEQTEAAFVNAAFNLARSSIAMTDAILKRSPDAIFINSESSEFCQPCCPDDHIEQIADFENQRRFLPLDLIYAHPVGDRMREYLREHGVEERDLAPFMTRAVPRRSVIGVDYYEWNERLVDRDGNTRSLGEMFGWYVLASQYYDRYQRTMMYTETNRMDAADAPRWLWRQWHNVQLIRQSGVPLIGFTWYSLTDQIDWDIGVSEAIGGVYPVGLVDLNRDARPAGLAYKHLIDMFSAEPEYRECRALQELLD